MCRFWLTCHDINQLLSIPVISHDYHTSTKLTHLFINPFQANIDRFHRNDCCFHIRRMPHHIATRKIQSHKLIIRHFANHRICNLRTSHPRPSLKRLCIRINLHMLFTRCFFITISIEIVRYMPKFHCF